MTTTTKNNYLWRFYWDCGRMGDLEGLFVATEEEVADAIGSEVYFGEVLGKHSEIYGTLEKCDVSKVDVSSDAVDELVGHLGYNWSGFNPLEYVHTHCDECDESMSEQDWHVEFYEEYDMSLCYECKEKLDAEKIATERDESDESDE